MVGQTECKVKVKKKIKSVLVTVSPHDLSKFIAIPKPSRNAKYSDISVEEKNEAIKLIQKSMKEEFQKNMKLKYDNKTKQWSVNGTSWDKYRLQKSFYIDFSSIEQIPADISNEILLQTSVMINGYKRMIQFPRMNREGKGTKEILTGWEGHVYKFMMHLSKIYPDAIFPCGLFQFRTNNIYHRLELRKYLLSLCAQNTKFASAFPQSTDKRSLKTTQVQALEKMMQSHKNRLGIFLWMLVGSGKTLTVLHYLSNTIVDRQIKKIVWSAPMSAIKSLSEEIKQYGWNYVLIAPTKAKKAI